MLPRTTGIRLLRVIVVVVVVVVATMMAVASTVTATATATTEGVNIIIIQPDDMSFFEQWNPPARFDPTLAPNKTGVKNTNDESILTNSMNVQEMQRRPPAVPTTTASHGHSFLPQIHSLRAQGLEMTAAYCASTMCGTSRYSTITGRYPSRSSYGRALAQQFRRDGNDDEQEQEDVLASSNRPRRNVIIPTTKLEDMAGNVVDDPYDCRTNNLAAVLQQQYGYRTGVVGKWHLSAPKIPNLPPSSSLSSLSSSSFSYRRQKKHIQACGFDTADALYFDNVYEGRTRNNRTYVTHNMEHVTSAAIQFMERAINQNRNFLLYFNPTVPHPSGDVTAALHYADCKETVEGTLATIPYLPFGMTAPYPTANQTSCRAYRHSVLQRGIPQYNASAAPYTSFDGGYTDASSRVEDKLAGSVWVDDAIGALLQTLDYYKIRNNTLVIFQLDHGIANKNSLFEGGQRIVQFIQYPQKISPATQYHGAVSTIDLAPTILDFVRAAATVAVTTATSTITETNTTATTSTARGDYNMDGTSWMDKVITPLPPILTPSNKGAPDIDIDIDIDLDGSNVDEEDYSIDHGTDNENYSDRCIFVEMGRDRSVRCGCYKYISIGDYPLVTNATTDDSPVTTVSGGIGIAGGRGSGERGDRGGGSTTAREAELKGVQGFGKDNYYYLCDAMTGKYISSGDSSSAIAATTQTISPEQYPAGDEYIDERIKKELRKKIQCLLNITDPFLRPNYGIDCSVPLFQNPQPKPIQQELIQIEDISESGPADDNETNNESESEPGTTESEDPVTITIGDLDAINIRDGNGCATVEQIICSLGNPFSILCYYLSNVLVPASDVMTFDDTTTTYTIFAPPDQLFERFEDTYKINFSSETSFEDDIITDIILFHIAVGAIRYEDLVCFSDVKMMNGEYSVTACPATTMLGIDLIQKGQMGGGNIHKNDVDDIPIIIYEDIETCNGHIIHVVNSILLPISFDEPIRKTTLDGHR